jgi:hypothetical protein
MAAVERSLELQLELLYTLVSSTHRKMNKYCGSLIVTFIIGCLFVCGVVMVIDPTAVAQTHVDPIPTDDRLVHETVPDRDPDPGRTYDPAAERQMADRTQASSSSTDTPTLLVGKVLDPEDGALSRTMVTLTEADGTKHRATSDSSGTFRFDEIGRGQQIRLSVENSQHSFTDLTIELSGETSVGWRATGK